MTNESISKFLSDYMFNPDPQYAIMLKGKWGCGKTHFVDTWLGKYNTGIHYTDEDIVLEPIKVS